MHSPLLDAWNSLCDGSSTKDGSGVGLIIEAPRGERHEHTLKFMFRVSNNKAKYKALIASTELCYMAGANLMQAYSDYQLALSQLNGEHEANDNTVAAYVHRVSEATSQLRNFEIIHILWSKNRQADVLSKLANASTIKTEREFNRRCYWRGAR